jgi:ComF family protein
VLAPALRGFQSLLAPPRCGCCALAAPAGEPLCRSCRGELERARPLADAGEAGLKRVVAAAEYRGAARELAHGLKFGRRLALAAVAAELIERACPPDVLRGTLVPVPAAPLRWLWRGFDAAEEISIALARRTGLELDRCLRRSGGPRQVGRPRRERLADPPRVRAAGEVPRRALLIDDVLTTGATLGACAAALRAAGCREVVALTLARSTSGPRRPLGESGAEA